MAEGRSCVHHLDRISRRSSKRRRFRLLGVRARLHKRHPLPAGKWNARDIDRSFNRRRCDSDPLDRQSGLRIRWIGAPCSTLPSLSTTVSAWKSALSAASSVASATASKITSKGDPRVQNWSSIMVCTVVVCVGLLRGTWLATENARKISPLPSLPTDPVRASPTPTRGQTLELDAYWVVHPHQKNPPDVWWGLERPRGRQSRRIPRQVTLEAAEHYSSVVLRDPDGRQPRYRDLGGPSDIRRAARTVR